MTNISQFVHKLYQCYNSYYGSPLPRHQFPIEKQEILTAAPSVVAGNVGNKQIKAYFTAVIIVTALNMLPQDRLHYSLSTQVLVNEALKI